MSMSMRSDLYASARSSFGGTSGRVPFPSAAPTPTRHPSAGPHTANSSVEGKAVQEDPVAVLLVQDVRLDVPSANSNTEYAPRVPPMSRHTSADRSARFRAPVAVMESLSVDLIRDANRACMSVEARSSGVHAALCAEQVRALTCIAHMHAEKMQPPEEAAQDVPVVGGGKLTAGAGWAGAAIDTSNFDGAESDDDVTAEYAAAAADSRLGQGLAAVVSHKAAAMKMMLQQVCPYRCVCGVVPCLLLNY